MFKCFAQVFFGCVAATCNDTVDNGDETDVDCGGSCAPAKKCANGKGCKIVADCSSGYCNLSTNKCQGKLLLFS